MTLDDAEIVVAAAKAKAIEMKEAVAIAVVDRRGDLVTVCRLDGAAHFTSDFALGKAMVSGTLGQASAAVADAGTTDMAQALNRMSQGRMIFYQGAVPVVKEGSCIGAVGVSGATTSVQDEEIAVAGAAGL